MAFHSELLPREAVGNTAFAVWIGLCRHATVRGRNLQLPEGCSQAQLGLASQHSVSWGCLYAWFFLRGHLLSSLSYVFLALSRMLLQSLNWKAPLEFPVAAHWNSPQAPSCSLGQGCRHRGRRPVDLPDDRKALWQSHWVSVNALNI